MSDDLPKVTVSVNLPRQLGETEVRFPLFIGDSGAFDILVVGGTIDKHEALKLAAGFLRATLEQQLVALNIALDIALDETTTKD